MADGRLAADDRLRLRGAKTTMAALMKRCKDTGIDDSDGMLTN
jgi:hypothetical protein